MSIFYCPCLRFQRDYRKLYISCIPPKKTLGSGNSYSYFTHKEIQTECLWNTPEVVLSKWQRMGSSNFINHSLTHWAQACIFKPTKVQLSRSFSETSLVDCDAPKYTHTHNSCVWSKGKYPFPQVVMDNVVGVAEVEPSPGAEGRNNGQSLWAQVMGDLTQEKAGQIVSDNSAATHLLGVMLLTVALPTTRLFPSRGPFPIFSHFLRKNFQVPCQQYPPSCSQLHSLALTCF